MDDCLGNSCSTGYHVFERHRFHRALPVVRIHSRKRSGCPHGRALRQQWRRMRALDLEAEEPTG